MSNIIIIILNALLSSLLNSAALYFLEVGF